MKGVRGLERHGKLSDLMFDEVVRLPWSLIYSTDLYVVLEIFKFMYYDLDVLYHTYDLIDLNI